MARRRKVIGHYFQTRVHFSDGIGVVFFASYNSPEIKIANGQVVELIADWITDIPNLGDVPVLVDWSKALNISIRYKELRVREEANE